jgi:uncharacterized membrane-anchored protein YitT (DUF2179 family)
MMPEEPLCTPQPKRKWGKDKLPKFKQRTGWRAAKFSAPLGKVMYNLALITIGSIIYIVGIQGILIPHEFLTGGTMGICLIFVYLFPALKLGWLYAIINIPLFLLGWLKVSNRFILYTGFGIASFSILLEVIHIKPLTVIDPILAAIFAGILCGLGAGLILRSAGSGGGLDILAVYLFKKFSIPFGWTSFAVNAGILAVSALIFNLEIALYTLIFVFAQSKLIDAVVTGFNRRKTIMVISDFPREIAQAIMNELHRGVTFLEGYGAYSGQEKRVVYSVVTLTELAKLKDLVLGIDPKAFVVINDTLDVVGSTMGKPKVY